MKSNNGFTLVSVLVYILCLILAMSTVMMLNSFFFSDVISMRGKGELANQYCKFNMFFIQDMREASFVDVLENDSNSWIQIKKKNGDGSVTYVNYTLNNNCIYRDDVKIAENATGLIASSISGSSSQENNIGVKVQLQLSYEEQSPVNYTTNYYIGRGY